MGKQEHKSGSNGHDRQPSEYELMLRAQLDEQKQMLSLYAEQVDILDEQVRDLHKKLRDKS